MKFLILSLALLGLVSGQSASRCQWNSNQVNNILLDDPPPGQTNGQPLGGQWQARDFPKNTTTQDFRELAQRLNGYRYIANTVPDGLNEYNMYWVPQNLSDKLAERPLVRPEGYKYSIITPNNDKYPCVEISGFGGFGLEIMVYALIDVEICIRHKYDAGSVNSQSAQLFNDICGQQRLRHCFIAPDFFGSGPTEFVWEIYVRPTTPVDYTVPVFYRMRRSEQNYKNQGSQFSSQNTEMWCQMVSGSVETTYPEFASVVPPNIRIPATNSASKMNPLQTFVKVLGATLVFALFGY